MRASRPASALALIAVLIAAGCGSSDGGTSTTTASESTVAATTAAAESTAAATTATEPAAGSTTTTDDVAARADWANSVCGALATWKSDLAAVGASLASEDLSQSALQGAANDLETASTTLTTSLKAVGAPPTPDGEQAKQAVDQLSDDLNSGVEQIKSDTANVSDAAGFAKAAAAVVATARTMGDQIAATVSQLRSLDANGDWEKAFSQTASCGPLATP